MTQWGLDNLFNPGKRHMDDEKRRLQSTREEVGDASGGRRIDLEGGKVSISVPRPAAPAPDAAETDSADEVATDDATALDPALAAEDVPAVALANDEAEIVPEVVASVASVEAVATAPPADEVAEPAHRPAPEPAVATAEDEPESAAEPAAAPEPEAAAPRRRAQSARAWARGG